MAELKRIKKYTRINPQGELEEHELSPKVKKRSLGIPPEYVSLGLYLALPLIFGVFIGQFIDKKVGTKGLFTISFIVIGTVLTFYSLYRLYGRDEATHQHKG